MKANPPSVLLLCLFCFALIVGDEALAVNESMEKYRYAANPVGDEDGQKETVEMKFIHSGLKLLYRMKTVSSEGSEDIQIEMEQTGRFFSALRRFVPTGEKTAAGAKIWRENNKAYLKKDTETEGKVRSFDLPREKSFAVDGSLLILLRGFPFGSDISRPIYMIDFSGSSVVVTLRQTGSESITVQAGTFDCYKMEVTVEIPFLKPRIIYWVTVKDPHFLVRSIGKRGPFTRSYVTSLITIER